MKTIFNVPMVETGIEYPASTGPVTFTEEDLAAMVESQNDPAIVAPRIKLGHTDPRFNSLPYDGNPALGICTNLRLFNSGHTVLCDIVGMPDWLADVLPYAFPNRSIEGDFMVETVTGHQWQFVCSDMALLGVIWPGVSTLDDLEITLSDAGPEGVEVVGVSLATSSIKASINLEDVRRAFYDQFATQESGRTWWWVRAVLLDPNELIVDDDNGTLFRVAFTVTDKTIAFGDPVQVVVEYVDSPVEAALVQSRSNVLLSTYTTSRDSRPASRSEAIVGRSVALTVDGSLLRRSLNLPDSASDEEVNQALQHRAQEQNQPEPTPTPAAPAGAPAPVEPVAPTTPTEPNQPAPTAPQTDQPAQPAQPAQTEPGNEPAVSGAVTVDRETLATLQRNAALGVEAFNNQRADLRDSFLQAAVAAGKFPPSRIDHWREAWETEYNNLGNADGIQATINSMPSGLIPVGVIGANVNDEINAGGPSYPPGWLPEVHRSPQSTITQES